MITLNSAVGIEIRGSELLLVCLKKGIRETRITGYKILENFRQIPRADLKRLVQTFFRENRVRRENIILGIPREQAVVRFLTLPREVKENLKQVIRFQVESFEPSEENGSYYDYAILEETEGEGAKLSLVLVIIKQAQLDEHLALFKDLQLPVQRVQISTLALSNLVTFAHGEIKKDAYFIFNFTENRSELIGLRNGRLAYSRLNILRNDIPIQGELLTELENALSSSRIPAENVDKILLTGRDAESIRQSLVSEMPEVELVTSKLKLGAPVHLTPYLPNLATPMGLALAGLLKTTTPTINLLPEAERIQRSRIWSVIAYSLLALLVLLAAAFFGREFYQERVYLHELENEIVALEPQVKEVDNLRKEIQALEDKIKYLQELFCAVDDNLELMGEMTTTIPDDTYLLYFSNRDGDIMFQGLSQSASALLPLLSKSKYMKSVEPQAPFTRDPVSGKERFSLKARMEAKSCN